MKILAVSDNVLSQLENADNLANVYGAAEILISCGDLPAHYLEYITSTMNLPLLYVRGNHDLYYKPEYPGGENLHGKVFNFRGFTFAGLEGCIRYNDEALQYSDTQMLFMVLGLAPKVLFHRLRTGRNIDIMVTHSPPRDIHDLPDRAHRGFKALRLLIRLYRPHYLIHGHVDTYDSRRPTRTQFAGTEIININPVKLLTVEPGGRRLHGLRESGGN
jgi:Icc-related predicted phosphoesterase